MEQTPNPENKLERKIVLEMLRTNGFEHPESKELLLNWFKQEEIGVEDSRGLILINIERANLFMEAGETGEAFKTIEDALYSADQENDTGLQDQIVERLKLLRVQYPELTKKLATFPLLSETFSENNEFDEFVSGISNPELAIEVLTLDEAEGNRLTEEQKEKLMELIEKDENKVYEAHLTFTLSGVEPTESEKWWLGRFEKILVQTNDTRIAEYVLENIGSLAQIDRERLENILK